MRVRSGCPVSFCDGAEVWGPRLRAGTWVCVTWEVSFWFGGGFLGRAVPASCSRSSGVPAGPVSVLLSVGGRAGWVLLGGLPHMH